MDIRSVYDTPPNGDFARYVEELGRQSAARVLQHGAPASPPPPRTALRTAMRAGPPAPETPRNVPPVQALRPVMTVAKWGLGLWVAYMVGVAVFPPLAVVGWPLLIFFIVAAATRLKSLPWNDLTQAARSAAAHKARQIRPPE